MEWHEFGGNWTHDCFDVVHQVVECDERKLGFEVRVFAQMPTGMTWLKSERP